MNSSTSTTNPILERIPNYPQKIVDFMDGNITRNNYPFFEFCTGTVALPFACLLWIGHATVEGVRAFH